MKDNGHEVWAQGVCDKVVETVAGILVLTLLPLARTGRMTIFCLAGSEGYPEARSSGVWLDISLNKHLGS